MLDDLTMTGYLALMFGIYLLAAAAGLWVHRQSFAGMLAALRDNPLLVYFGGLIAFAIGVVLVRVHNEWGTWLAGFVSLVGWAALIEGLLLIAVPRFYLGIFEGLFHSERAMRVMAVFCLLLGVLLVGLALG